MAGVVAQALDERAGKWVDLPFTTEELGEIMSCVVCTEPYYGGDSSRLPHETCIHGHTCCVDCYARLTRGLTGEVTCPMCRQTTATSRLRVLGETDGILGMLVLRNRLRWACAARCGFSGRLAAVRAHTAKCPRVLVPCAMCDAHVARASCEAHMLAEHARATVSVRSGRARAVTIASPRILLLPLGISVVVRPEPGYISVSVVSGGSFAHDQLIELELALFRDEGQGPGGCCTCIDVLALARSGATERASFTTPPTVVSATCRVPLYTVPALGLVRIGGAQAMHVVGEALGESMLVPTRRGGAQNQAQNPNQARNQAGANAHSHVASPYVMASNAMVGITEARVGNRCWIRETGTGVCKLGTVVRLTDATAIVRTNGSLVETPRVLCGAMGHMN